MTPDSAPGPAASPGPAIAPAAPQQVSLGQVLPRVRTPKELEREVRTTLLHEIAHYLGFDEDDMQELGL